MEITLICITVTTTEPDNVCVTADAADAGNGGCCGGGGSGCPGNTSSMTTGSTP